MFVCVQLLKSFPTLCDPMDCVAWPGSSVHGGFSRQEYWSGLPFPSPGDLPDSGIELASLLHLLHLQAGSLPLHHLRSLLTGEMLSIMLPSGKM